MGHHFVLRRPPKRSTRLVGYAPSTATASHFEGMVGGARALSVNAGWLVASTSSPPGTPPTEERCLHACHARHSHGGCQRQGAAEHKVDSPTALSPGHTADSLVAAILPCCPLCCRPPSKPLPQHQSTTSQPPPKHWPIATNFTPQLHTLTHPPAALSPAEQTPGASHSHCQPSLRKQLPDTVGRILQPTSPPIHPSTPNIQYQRPPMAVHHPSNAQ